MVNAMIEQSTGEIIKKHLKEKRMSQRELALRSGVSREYINMLVTGKRKGRLSLETAQAIADVLGITVSALQGKEETFPAGEPEEWDKHTARRPLRVNVYSDYAKVHAGTPVEVIGHLYVDRPEKAPFNIKAYRVEGDCMEPDYHDGEFVIVDHDLAIENGDRVVALCDGQLHIAKLKIIGSEYWLQNRYSTKKMTDCQGVAKVIGHYGK